MPYLLLNSFCYLSTEWDLKQAKGDHRWVSSAAGVAKLDFDCAGPVPLSVCWFAFVFILTTVLWC